jgi:O-antigen ligase
VHAVTFGELLGLALIGASCLALRRADARAAAVSKVGLAAFLALAGLAFILNQTRGAFLGVGAGLLALSASDKKLRKLAAGLLIGGPLLLVIWELLPTGHTFGEMIARMKQPGPNPFLARLTLWRVGWEIFQDHPVLGVGPGNYRSIFTTYYQGYFDGENVWGSAHNLYIHHAAERGLLGLTALFSVLGALCLRAWRRARIRPDAANLWALGACAGFLVMNLTEVAFQNEQVCSLLLFIWAWAEGRPEADKKA